MDMNELTVEVDQEEDRRWICEVTDLPGVVVYGVSRDEAVTKAKALAFRVLADRLDHGETIPQIDSVFAVHGQKSTCSRMVGTSTGPRSRL
jgi:predicted RNase H-like HicB family nuclease